MKKEDIIFVEHILDSLNKIEKFIDNFSERKFLEDEKLQDAVIRRIEIIGEAAKNISSDFKKKYPNVPWVKITGMRDKLIHHYFGINLKIIWNVIKEDIPMLKREIILILKKESNN